MPFRNPLALLGLLSIIPLIIIYLIRPKPREVRFPSTIFLESGEIERSAVLSRLITDPLFWVQLLILASLSIAAAGPYTTAEGAPSTHLVLILDNSASMESSFGRAVQAVEPYLEGYDAVSIVLAESIPIVALQSGSSSEARDILSRLSTRSVSADLSSAMLLGSGLLGPDGGNMLVISDFRSWTGDDPDATRKAIESENVGVVFKDVDGAGDNVAIIGGWNVEAGGYINHTALIHNYGAGRTVPITVSGSGGTTSRTVSLASGEDFYLSLNAFPGVTTISLDVSDAISADNRDYIYQPEVRPRDALYLGEAGPALVALQSLPGVNAQISGDYGSFDLVVISKNASANGELNRYIDRGGKVVYLAASSDESPQYLPVKVTGEETGPVPLWVRSPQFAEDIDFSEIGIFGYLKATARRQSTTMIEAGGYPILSYWRLGEGTVIYDGLDYSSDFYQRPSYPIFWLEMVGWLTGVPDASESNRKTGEVIPLPEATPIGTPYGQVTTSTLLLDAVGVYDFQGSAISANMYDPEESDISQPGASFSPGQFRSAAGRESFVNRDISPWIMALALLMVALEIALLRRRREA